MAEYIDKQAAIADLNETYDKMSGFHPQFYNGYQFAVNRLRVFQTAEVEPVVHGRWIWNENACTWDCSNCNGSVGAGSRISKYAHCPFCGARMDGGADNEK